MTFIHCTSVYDKRDDFGFPVVNFPWLSCDVPRLTSFGFFFIFRSWLDSLGSVPVDFLRPKFRVAHTKDDVISISMHKYTYIIKNIISCRFILCWDITSLFKPYEKSCRRFKVKIEKIFTVTYHTLLTKTTTSFRVGIWNMSLSKDYFLFHII